VIGVDGSATSLHALDWALDEIARIQEQARNGEETQRPTWPMIVLRTPKGWTGPKVVDGQQVEGTFRSHQVPVTDFKSKPDHLRILEDWLRSYRAEELFDARGRLKPELAELAPRGARRMSATHMRTAVPCSRTRLPDFRSYAVDVLKPARPARQRAVRHLRDVIKRNQTASA
jgi:xylulose-5-phosphate/fructose-6-phosphate phosphoketolase